MYSTKISMKTITHHSMYPILSSMIHIIYFFS